MALIKCSECEREISDKSRSCPHCGCPIEKEIEIYDFIKDKLEKNNFVKILIVVSFVIMCLNMYLLNELEFGSINFVEIIITISIMILNIIYVIIIDKKVKEINIGIIIASLVIIILPSIVLISMTNNITEWRKSHIGSSYQETYYIELSPLGTCNYSFHINYFKEEYANKEIEVFAYRRNQCSWKKDGDLYTLRIVYNGEKKNITCSKDFYDGNERLKCKSFIGDDTHTLEKQ